MKKFLLAILLIVVASPVMAAHPVIRFRQLKQSSGLSNNQVNVLYKDATGFIWVGTMQGLNSTTHAPKNFHAMPTNGCGNTALQQEPFKRYGPT